MATNDELVAEIEARGGTVPETGSGKDGAVVKADLEAALADLPESEAPEAGMDITGPSEGVTHNGNKIVTH